MYDKEPEINLQGLEDEDYAGAFGATNIEDIREWLGADEDDVGYQNLTEEEIVYQMPVSYTHLDVYKRQV